MFRRRAAARDFIFPGWPERPENLRVFLEAFEGGEVVDAASFDRGRGERSEPARRPGEFDTGVELDDGGGPVGGQPAAVGEGGRPCGGPQREPGGRLELDDLEA